MASLTTGTNIRPSIYLNIIHLSYQSIQPSILSIYPTIYLINLSIHLSYQSKDSVITPSGITYDRYKNQFIYLSFYLSIYLITSIHLSIYLSNYLSQLSIKLSSIYPFNHLSIVERSCDGTTTMQSSHTQGRQTEGRQTQGRINRG